MTQIILDQGFIVAVLGLATFLVLARFFAFVIRVWHEGQNPGLYPCDDCGNRVAPSAIFCPQCGSMLKPNLKLRIEEVGETPMSTSARQA